MADCGDLLTNQDLSNAKKDATTINDYVESDQYSIISKNGKVIRTLEGTRQDAQDAIDSFKRTNKGDYSSGPLTLEDGFEYTSYAGDGKDYFAVMPPYTTDPLTYPDPSLDPNLTSLSYVLRSEAVNFDNDRQKETTGLSDITDASIGLDIFPLIGQGLRVAGIGLWVVTSVTADGSPMPNPANLDAVPTGPNVTVNGGTSVVLNSLILQAGDVNSISSVTYPIGSIVESYYVSNRKVQRMEFIVESPSIADGFVNHNDASGNLLRYNLPTITPSQAGAVVDGVTDDSPSIAAIVASGVGLHNTDIGECFMQTAVDVDTDNYQITGMGKQTAFRSAGNEPCFRLNGSDQLVYNCGFAGDGTRANTIAATNGALVRILGDRGAVIGCNFYDYRFGVEARGPIDSPKVKFNVFREGLNEASDDHTVVGTTIDIRTNDNDQMENPEVVGNDMKDGIGSGIDFYAQDSTSDGSYRSGTSTGGISGGKIALNKIKHGFQYGIQLYRRGGSAALNVSRVNVTDNEIDDITGDTVNSNSGTRIYGSGIYNQGAEDTLIQGNIISRTCKATNDNTLTPAGIGVINAASVKVIGNEVNQTSTQSGATATAGGVGIWIKNTNVTPNNAMDGFGQDPTNKNVKVVGNVIRSTLFQGIYAQDVVNFSASESNDVANTGTQGIQVQYSGGGFFAAEYTACPNPTVDDNIVNQTTSAGIEFSGVENFSGDDNRITDPGTEGIRVTTATSGSIVGNNITDPVSSNHIVLTNNASDDVNVTNNICDGGTTHQIRSFRQVKVRDNIHKNIAATFSAVSYVGATTSNTGWWPITDGDATPSVFNSVQLQTSNSGATTITAFDDVPEGHDFSVLVVDGNTTIQFSGPNLSGNGGVDLVAPSGTLLVCRVRGGITYCLVS